MSEQTQKSDELYDALDEVIAKHQKGMTTYQILGTLLSLIIRFHQRNTTQPGELK